MFWILTVSVPGDDRVFTIGSRAEFPAPSPPFSSPPAASMPLHWVIPHMVRHLPLAIRLLPENIQEHAFVRRARRLAILHGGPRHLIRPPNISDLSIAADTLWRHDQLCYLGWRRIRRKPVFVQSLFVQCAVCLREAAATRNHP